jgi:hypothetical protein
MESVVITGVSRADPRIPPGTVSLEELIFSAAAGALDDGSLSRNELDGVVIAASDQVDGRAISSMLTAGPSGAYLNEEINTASSPGHALALATLQILAGTHSRILVSSWGKASETAAGHTQAAERLSAEPFVERDGGLSSLAATAMQAGLHRSRIPDAAAAAAAVAARNHSLGGDPAITSDDVSNSPLRAWPLRSLELPEEIDDSVSIVLERAGSRDHAGPVIYLAGLGWSMDGGRVAERDLLDLPHLRQAGLEALGRARAAAGDVDLWELHDYSPDAQLLACPALGICESGATAALALCDGFSSDGSAPVNPAGGSVRGEAPFGGPLNKVALACRQLRGEAGRAQVRDATLAVAQLCTGFAGQLQSIFVLSAEARA